MIRMKNPEFLAEFARIERAYSESIQVGKQKHPGFWKSRTGYKAADGQVVAVAKVFYCTVVSDDNAVKAACALEDVPCISWTEFARRLGLVGPAKQLSLFEVNKS